MNEFLKMATAQIGLEPGQAKSATTGLLGFLKKEGDGAELQSLLAKLPGSEDLLTVEAGAASGGGLMGAVSGLAGGRLGSSLGLLSTLRAAGLDSGSSGRFVQLFFDFAEQKAGGEVVDGLLTKLPEVRKLLR